jgi:hypothetical protein
MCENRKYIMKIIKQPLTIDVADARMKLSPTGSRIERS